MQEFSLHRFNTFRERHIFSMNLESKGVLSNFTKNSLFLRKVIESKEKERKESRKKIETDPAKSTQMFENLNELQKSQYERAEKINRYSKCLSRITITLKDDKEESNKENENNSNTLSNFAKISNLNLNKNKRDSFPKIPMTISHKSLKSRNINQNRFYMLNREASGNESDRHVVNINGKKIFTTSSFTNLNSKTLSESNRIKNSNYTELYRNYNELKLKKEEIYKRKIKKDDSIERKEMLKIQKDKEIKKFTIDTIYIDNKNNNKYKTKIIKKFNRIPNGKSEKIKEGLKTFYKETIYKKNLNSIDVNSFKTTKNNENENNSLKNSSKIRFKYSKIALSKNRSNNNIISHNYNIINKKINQIPIYNKKRNSSNSYLNTKNIYYSINNIDTNKEINKIEVNKNLAYFKRKKNENKTISNNKNKNKNLNSNSNSSKQQQKYNNKTYTPEKHFDLNIFINSKKKFVEDQLSNSFIVTNDNKLYIKIHSIQNINCIFQIKRKNRQKLKIQKINNIFLSKTVILYLNYLVNFNSTNNIKKNNLVLSTIKEEEKSKAELTKSDSKIEEKNKSKNNEKNKKKKINGLKKMFFIPIKTNNSEEFKNIKEID